MLWTFNKNLIFLLSTTFSKGLPYGAMLSNKGKIIKIFFTNILDIHKLSKLKRHRHFLCGMQLNIILKKKHDFIGLCLLYLKYNIYPLRLMKLDNWGQQIDPVASISEVHERVSYDTIFPRPLYASTMQYEIPIKTQNLALIIFRSKTTLSKLLVWFG